MANSVNPDQTAPEADVRANRKTWREKDKMNDHSFLNLQIVFLYNP